MENNRIFKLESSCFKDGAEIGKIHTCEVGNVAPDLLWSGAPENTASFALICDDPDAATSEPWVHWIVYNIPASNTSLEDLDHIELLPDGIMQGLNTFNHIGYDGPCPPLGENHRYFFRLYALDIMPKLNPAFTKNRLLEAIKDHIIGEATLIGTYIRRKSEKEE